MSVVILDNGAGKIKAGLTSSKPLAHSPATMQVKSSNCTARMNKQMNILVADEVDSCLNGSLLHYTRPFERGYLTNWQSETEVWSRVFGNKGLKINTAESILCTTEAPFTPEPLQNDMNEVVFEEFGFQSCLRRPAAWFSAHEFSTSSMNGITSGASCTVIDSGFSFTYAMPFIDGKCRKAACKRVNVGGKLLTNFLKEIVSYRQWNMMDEFKIIDQVKEELCYVSTDFQKELQNSKRSPGSAPNRDFQGENLKKFFVLPDYHKITRGFVKQDANPPDADEQLLTMETERFSVPEVLFSPSDVGMNQAGVAEATMQCLGSLPLAEMGLAAANVVLTGGNVRFPQFRERFSGELRALVPDIFPMSVHLPEDPDNYAWNGMARFVEKEVQHGTLSSHLVSKAEYLEKGHYHCNKRFYDSW